MKKPKIAKIVLVGGHPAPALAVIERIKLDRPEWDLYFLGAKHSLTRDKAISYEYKETRRFNIPFYNITTGKRNSNLLTTPIGFMQSLLWLKRLRPEMVLTFGGYLGVPVAFAAKMLQIPIVTHVQTLQTSLADKIIGELAKKVFISWPQTKQTVAPDKVILTGLPLRKSILDAQKPKFAKLSEKTDKPLLYVTGGSQGAHFINQFVEKNLEDLSQHFYIVHQIGESTKYKDLWRLQELRQPTYVPLAHIGAKAIGWVLRNADLVVSRAGMNIVCELLYFKKHALLIPLPMDNNEQLKNARLYASSGLGTMIEQKKATPDMIMRALFELYANIRQRRLSVKRIKGADLQSPAAAEKIVLEMEKILRGDG